MSKFNVQFDIEAMKKAGMSQKMIDLAIGSVTSVETISTRISSGLMGVLSQNGQSVKAITDNKKTVTRLNTDKAVKLSESLQATLQPVISLLQGQNLAYQLKNAKQELYNSNHLAFVEKYRSIVNERCDAHISAVALEIASAEKAASTKKAKRKARSK